MAELSQLKVFIYEICHPYCTPLTMFDIYSVIHQLGNKVKLDFDVPQLVGPSRMVEHSIPFTNLNGHPVDIY